MCALPSTHLHQHLTVLLQFRSYSCWTLKRAVTANVEPLAVWPLLMLRWSTLDWPHRRPNKPQERVQAGTKHLLTLSYVVFWPVLPD
jgi:hypothetical protein